MKGLAEIRLSPEYMSHAKAATRDATKAYTHPHRDCHCHVVASSLKRISEMRYVFERRSKCGVAADVCLKELHGFGTGIC